MEDTRASTQLLKMVTALHGTRERKAGVAPRTRARVMQEIAMRVYGPGLGG